MIRKTVSGLSDYLKDLAVKDSGERREFATGAVRDTAGGKSRPDLISPFALMRVGEWMEKGRAKYGERNWEKGFPDSVLYASMLRHALKYAKGERDEDHLSAVIFNAQALIHQEETGKRELHDMPRYEPCWLSAMGDADRDAERVLERDVRGNP